MPSNDIAVFEEGIFQQGLSHKQGIADFGYGIAAGIFYDVGTGNVEVRANQGNEVSGTTSATLGAASTLSNANLTLDTTFTKTAAGTPNS